MVAQWAPASAPSKNEFSMFWFTSVPNFMLVDKSAQYPPLKFLRARTIKTFFIKVPKYNQYSPILASDFEQKGQESSQLDMTSHNLQYLPCYHSRNVRVTV